MTSRKSTGLLSRRTLLASAVAAAAIRPIAVAETRKARGYIDLHHHFYPPGTVNIPIVQATPTQTVEAMDRAGIGTAIGWPGAILDADQKAGRQRARDLNGYGAQLGRDFPGRFGLFASLPALTDTDGCLEEIAYALDVLQADGVGISTNYGDIWLGDPRIRPVLDELDRRAANVFVHPGFAPCCTRDALSYQQGIVSEPWLEFPFNTARTILNLMVMGTLRALPKIRFIFCHGGGAMPALIGRIEGLSAWQAVGPEKFRQVFPEGVEAEFGRLYFECAQSFAPANMELLHRLVPTSNLFYGTDYPHFPLAHSGELYRRLDLHADARYAIERGNAERLMPRWRL